MKVEGRVVVVTGGAQGIGAALCRCFHAAGAAGIAVADIDHAGAERVAAEVGGIAFRCDVSREVDVAYLVVETERRLGPIGLFCSNAGVAMLDPDPDNAASAPDSAWMKSWGVNVMAHVYAARTLVPLMAERGGGWFLNTVSAAGLLSQIGGAVYATTKHAAVGFAEVLALTHRDQGIGVSILCPQGVDTAMLRSLPKGPQSRDGVLSPEAVAEAALQGLEAERFLILPHAEVATYMARKAQDYDRWLSGMSRLRDKLKSEG